MYPPDGHNRLRHIDFKKPGRYIGNLVDEIPHTQKNIINKFPEFAISLPSLLFFGIYGAFAVGIYSTILLIILALIYLVIKIRIMVTIQ
jgi:hypothetical protein